MVECSGDVPDLTLLFAEGVRSGTTERSGATRSRRMRELSEVPGGHSARTEGTATAGVVFGRRSGVVPGGTRCYSSSSTIYGLREKPYENGLSRSLPTHRPPGAVLSRESIDFALWAGTRA